MKSGSENSLSAPMRGLLADLTRASGGVLRFDEFMQCALYHPEHGYYQASRKRVGRNQTTDFYTAQSLGPVFSRLVLSAIEELAAEALGEFVFVELGPESPGGILDGLKSHPFHSCVQIRPGEHPSIPPRSILFSNEVFDAQPFRRFVMKKGAWRELGVVLRADCLDWNIIECPMDLPPLPEHLPEDYIIDWPAAAHSLMKHLTGQPWTGLFLAFDYGLPRPVVLRDRPGGTARTYSGHQLGSNLLANPGQTDITCHLIWDELETILQNDGFKQPTLQSQEAFFMHHSKREIGKIIESFPPGFSREKQTLMELLHPDNMGGKFQVLHGWRGES